jgi:hypothetical protein
MRELHKTSYLQNTALRSNAHVGQQLQQPVATTVVQILDNFQVTSEARSV